MPGTTLSSLLDKFLIEDALSASEQKSFRDMLGANPVTFERQFYTASVALPELSAQEFMVTRIETEVRSVHVDVGAASASGDVTVRVYTDLAQEVSITVPSGLRYGTHTFTPGEELVLAVGEVVSVEVTDDGGASPAEGVLNVCLNANYAS